ncbi:DUF4921 family protein [Candidatus Woesearchaeota archaeon]|nr:DUF4921 family protein [Candidatus Woesearchaeota archaeon]
MGIIRKDYILDRWVYYAVSRKKRPQEFKKIVVKEDGKGCFFCPSNEHLTPKEIGRVEYKGSWKIRWFLNKFPAVEKKGKPAAKSKKYLLEGSSYGIHEVIVETPHHKSQLADLPAAQIRELLEVCKFRISCLGKLKGIRYVDVFKNHGKDAGTSLFHSHTQVMALPHIPSLVMEKANAAKKYRNCPYCEIIKIEARSKRKIFETKNAIAFAPFASRFNYEAWIFVKSHKRTMEELEESELTDIAAALKKVISKLKKSDISYNFYIHYSPAKENLHFHIEVTPRLATWGGFEISTNAVINSVMPEDAARFYRK